jgi:DNA-binding transcriptional ArsR family regulator
VKTLVNDGPGSARAPDMNTRGWAQVNSGLADAPPTDDTEPHGSVFPARLDATFAALADTTRRGVLERLGRGDASITELAGAFGMTLTGMKTHVRVLEGAGLVTTEKVGRVRHCRLGPRRLEEETAWIAQCQPLLEARYDRLGEFLRRTRGDRS